jgi:hypothetical protein
MTLNCLSLLFILSLCPSPHYHHYHYITYIRTTLRACCCIVRLCCCCCYCKRELSRIMADADQLVWSYTLSLHRGRTLAQRFVTSPELDALSVSLSVFVVDRPILAVAMMVVVVVVVVVVVREPSSNYEHGSRPKATTPMSIHTTISQPQPCFDFCARESSTSMLLSKCWQTQSYVWRWPSASTTSPCHASIRCRTQNSIDRAVLVVCQHT